MFLGRKDREVSRLAKMPKDDFVSYCLDRLLALGEDEVANFHNLLVKRQAATKNLDRGLSAEEVKDLYRLILEREPNSNELDVALHEFVNVRTLRNYLFLSEEFCKKNEEMRFAHASVVVIKDLSCGLRIYLDLIDRVCATKILYGEYKLAERDFVRSFLKEGDFCIDVGSAQGYFALHMAEVVGASGLVHCFEPMSEHYSLLRASIKENRFDERARCFPVALGYKPMQTFMAVPGKEGANPMSSAFLCYDERMKFGHHLRPVQVDSLDAQAIDRKVSLIKISAEGAEPFVIRGGRELILKHKPLLLVELSRVKLAHVSDCTPEALLYEMKKIGYRAYKLNEYGVKHEFERAPDNFTAVLVWE